MLDSPSVPYSRQGLENLAAALNVNSAYLWVNPTSTTFQMREPVSRSAVDEEGVAAQADDNE